MRIGEILELSNEELNVRVAEGPLGIDLTANTPDRIDGAIMSGMFANSPSFKVGVPDRMSFSWPFSSDDRYDLYYTGSYYYYGGTEGNNGYGLHFWEQRFGQPWQAAMEAHVASWRAKPDDYAGSWDAAMGIRNWACEDELRANFYWEALAGFAGHRLNDEYINECLYAEPIDYARAALALPPEYWTKKAE